MKTLDLTGKRFGRLTVLERAENNKKREKRWKCVCDCGKETIAVSYRLINGRVKSCGCLQRDVAKNIGNNTRTVLHKIASHMDKHEIEMRQSY